MADRLSHRLLSIWQSCWRGAGGRLLPLAQSHWCVGQQARARYCVHMNRNHDQKSEKRVTMRQSDVIFCHTLLSLLFIRASQVTVTSKNVVKLAFFELIKVKSVLDLFLLLFNMSDIIFLNVFCMYFMNVFFLTLLLCSGSN